MLLVIENKDDPTGQIAAELDDTGGAELAYIPVITVRLGCDEKQARLKCAVDRMSYKHRNHLAEDAPTPQMSEKLVPLFLKALCHIGERPSYLSPSAMKDLGDEPEGHKKLYARG